MSYQQRCLSVTLKLAARIDASIFRNILGFSKLSHMLCAVPVTEGLLRCAFLANNVKFNAENVIQSVGDVCRHSILHTWMLLDDTVMISEGMQRRRCAVEEIEKSISNNVS